MQKYNILELNEKLLPELQSIAEELGIKKVSSLKKEELRGRILMNRPFHTPASRLKRRKKRKQRKQKGRLGAENKSWWPERRKAMPNESRCSRHTR